MNRSDDLTPQLRSWLKEPVTLREDGIAAVGREVHIRPQQHGPLPPLQSAPSHSPPLWYCSHLLPAGD